MVIPFPERVPVIYATIFAGLLCTLLMLSGTGPYFASMAFVFFMATTMAFNLAGGMTRPSGSFVFFFAFLTVILGLIVKVILWEPAEIVLHSPNITMTAYAGSMLAMMASVYVSRRFSRKEGFLQEVCSTENMELAAIGCVVGGVVIPLLNIYAFSTNSPLLVPIATAMAQIDRFLAMGIILGTTSAIKMSGGKRSINTAVVLAAGIMWFTGFFVGFSKEALFTPFVCWLAAGAALRYRYSLQQVVLIALSFAFCSYYLVPYSQVGRNYKSLDSSYTEQIAISYGIITNLSDVRETFKVSSALEHQDENAFAFYKTPQGLFDRLEMFAIDDALVTVTEQKGTFGMSPYLLYAAGLVPRVLWKDKPSYGIGNKFAHEIGFNEDDLTTGISISSMAEAYHEAKWFGVLIVQPLLWSVLFVVFDSLCGDVRKSPWGILTIAMFSHVAPEGALQGIIYTSTDSAFGICFVAFFSAYVMPLLAALVSPPKRKIVELPTGAGSRAPVFANAQPASLSR